MNQIEPEKHILHHLASFDSFFFKRKKENLRAHDHTGCLGVKCLGKIPVVTRYTHLFTSRNHLNQLKYSRDQ